MPITFPVGEAGDPTENGKPEGELKDTVRQSVRQKVSENVVVFHALPPP